MKKITTRKQQGFTLIELLITVAIVGILAVVAIPVYQDYIYKARFSEVILATANYKLAVELEYQSGNADGAATDDLDSGSFDIPAAITVDEGHLDDLSVTDGIITAQGTAGSFGGATPTYILTPSVAGSGKLTWAATGSCGKWC